MKNLQKKSCLILIIFFMLNPFPLMFANNHFNEDNSLQVIEWRPTTAGLFSQLMRVAEWIYCVQQHQNLGLYVNMLSPAYDFQGNLFSALFQPFEDPLITTHYEGPITYRIERFPSHEEVPLNAYACDGMAQFQNRQPFVYGKPGLYRDPDFCIFRERLHAVIMQYFQPVPELLDRIDRLIETMNQPMEEPGLDEMPADPTPILKIGIHVRFVTYYENMPYAPEEFLDRIVSDIDQMMASKDPRHTRIFLATLYEPLVKRLRAKYDVVLTDIPRFPNMVQDWYESPHVRSLATPQDVIVDTWTLAKCDELWCGASNICIFAACLNPSLKITLLPTLQNHNGG